MLFSDDEEFVEFDNEQELTEYLVNNYALSPHVQQHLDKIPLEKQAMHRVVVQKVIEDLTSTKDENLVKLIEKTLYDLFLTCATGRYALMFQCYTALAYYSTGINILWDVLIKHLDDIQYIDNPDFVDTTSPYIVQALLAYEITIDPSVMVLQEALEYFSEESPDDEIMETLRSIAGVLVAYNTYILPEVRSLHNFFNDSAQE